MNGCGSSFFFLYFKTLSLFFKFICSCVGYSWLCRLFSSCGERGLLSSCCGGASHCRGFSVAETGSIAAAHGLSCSSACGIFLDQGSNLCLLHGWVDSLTLSHQGSPGSSFLDETPLTIMEFSAQPEATYFSAKAHRRG